MVQSISSQISAQVNNVLRPQPSLHAPTKADLFAEKFNEHVRQLASPQAENRISNNRHWAMGIAQTEIPGSFGKTHIAPNILNQMEADPVAHKHFTDKIRDFQNKIPDMKREFSMMGMEITSVSLIIHEDGSVTYMTWARAKTNGIESRESHESYNYGEQLIFSENADLSDIIKSMAGLLNSANPSYRKILELA